MTLTPKTLTPMTLTPMTQHLLRCSECETVYDPEPSLLVCPSCSRLQSAGDGVRGVLHVDILGLENGLTESGRLPKGECDPSKWSFDHLLPVSTSSRAERRAVSVGGTPLLEAPRLARDLGLLSEGQSRLWIKDDTRNPSGSTKDRASDLVVRKALEHGFKTLAVASTGNAATALAASVAATGLTAVVFVPASAPEAKQVQMATYGARVIAIDGTYDQAFELCLAACQRWNWYNRNTALNPFTIEGKKTAALEIAAQLHPQEPDVVLVPTGDGVILAGIAKGFDDLHRAGLLRRRPRLIAVQPEGSAAIVRALEHGLAAPEAFAGAASVADSLVVDAPRNGRLCLQRIRESEGAGVTVTDRQIVSSIQRLARSTGVFAEPAAASVLAGLEEAMRLNLVDPDENIVLMVTGTGLKDVAAAARGLAPTSPIPPSLEAVEQRVETWKEAGQI